MLNKNYLYDLMKWEVVLYGEDRKDDKRLGLYDTVEEAEKALWDFHKEMN